MDAGGKHVEIVGIQRPISLCMIFTMHMKRCARKGCQLFVVRVNDVVEGESSDDLLQRHPIFQEFVDAFKIDFDHVTQA